MAILSPAPIARARAASGSPIVVGTRGSALALWQTNWALERVRERAPEASFSVQTISTQGDHTQARNTPLARLGDKGVQSTFELRSPALDPFSYSLMKDWRIAAFYDSAALWLEQPLPGEQASFGLHSAGIGTRFTLADVLTGALDLAFPLADGAVTRAGDPYLHFRFSAGF